MTRKWSMYFTILESAINVSLVNILSLGEVYEIDKIASISELLLTDVGEFFIIYILFPLCFCVLFDSIDQTILLSRGIGGKINFPL